MTPQHQKALVMMPQHQDQSSIRPAHSAKTRLRLLAAGLLSLAGVSGCGFLEAMKIAQGESAEWRKQAEAAQKQVKYITEVAQKQLEESRKQADKLGKQMVEAADTLDPGAFKSTFREIKDLRSLNQRLEAQLAAAMSAKDKVLTGNLRIRLAPGYSGSGVVRGCLDGTDELIFKSHIQARPHALDVKCNLAEARYEHLKEALKANPAALDGIFKSIPTHEQLFPIYPWLESSKEGRSEPWRFFNQKIASAYVQRRSEVDEDYRKAIDKAFATFLDEWAVLKPTEPGQWHLDRLSLTPGRHEIRLTVTDATPTFSATVVLEEILPDKQVVPARSIDLDATTTQTFSESQNFAFRVWSSDGTKKSAE